MTAFFAAAAFGTFLLAAWRIVTGRRRWAIWGPAWATYGANAIYCWSTGREDAYWIAWVIWISVWFGLFRLGRWGYDAVRTRAADRSSPQDRA